MTPEPSPTFADSLRDFQSRAPLSLEQVEADIELAFANGEKK